MPEEKNEETKKNRRIIAVIIAIVVPCTLAVIFWRTTPAVGGWANLGTPAKEAAPADYAKNGRMPVSGSAALNPEVIYRQNCAKCHGENMEGSGTVPALKRPNWPYKNNRDLLITTIHQGRGLTMPSFDGRLSNKQIEALADYLQAQNGVK
jgi:mono/diheme cytochrome c family protein